jgi:hypothetical protein
LTLSCGCERLYVAPQDYQSYLSGNGHFWPCFLQVALLLLLALLHAILVSSPSPAPIHQVVAAHQSGRGLVASLLCRF